MPLHLRELTLKDLFKADFWRQLFRILWMFFPAIIFLIFAWFAFWKLTQGQDLIQITLEKQNVYVFFIASILFWSYTTWYTSRAVAKAKHYQQPDDNEIWQNLRIHGPRLLAFTCFSIILLAFFQVPFGKIIFPAWLCYVLLLLSLFYYFFLWKTWDRYIDNRTKKLPEDTALKFLKTVRFTTYAILISCTVAIAIFKWFWALIILMLGLQIGLVLLLTVRRKIIEGEGRSASQLPAAEKSLEGETQLRKKFLKVIFDAEDKAYTKGFFLIGAIALVIYLITVFNIRFAIFIGTFPFIFFAFGILLILGNFTAAVSVFYRFNFHLLFFLLAAVIGHFFEPHLVRVTKKQNPEVLFKNRQNLKEYFTSWVQQRIPDTDTISEKIPVYFVLANGGASRSGYWTASVLSKLEDTTNGEFSKHLFCLSGASGGSVGNGAFYSALRSKKQILAEGKSNLAETKKYLRSDFLTYTLARMLGPDVFRHIFPFPFIQDRAAALSYALENAAGSNSSIDDSMHCQFSSFITQKNYSNYQLPVLCINTTRMQDGSPAVFSTIDISDTAFNKRIDVLDLLDENEDIKLSSAIVLGASFPYISPAGRIDTRVAVYKDDKRTIDTITEPNFFVDGGYFDNSGAGVVNEMIIAMRQLLEKDSVLHKYKNKLEFFVLHIANDPIGEFVLPKVNPLVNDLAAPVKTLMGAYGSQTAVNDSRLQNYMRNAYNDEGHYIILNLYRPHDKINFSMNWVISDTIRNLMNSRVDSLYEMKKVMNRLR